MSKESGFTPSFHAEYLAVYAGLCERVPDLAERAIGICDDIYWGRGSSEYHRAVHYGLMHEQASARHNAGDKPPQVGLD